MRSFLRVLGAVVVSAMGCTTFGTAPEPDPASDASTTPGDAGRALPDVLVPRDAFAVPPQPATFCSTAPPGALLCADFETPATGLAAFDSTPPPSSGTREVVVDQPGNRALEMAGDDTTGRARKLLAFYGAYRLAFRVKVQAVEDCDTLVFGGFTSARQIAALAPAYAYGAALYAPSPKDSAFQISGRKYQPAAVAIGTAPSRWFAIEVAVDAPTAAGGPRITTVRIDGGVAPDQTSDEPLDTSIIAFGVDLGRIEASNCGKVALRYDDVLVTKK